MRFTPFALSCGALLSAALFCPRADAQQTPEFIVGKIARYTQTGSGAASPLAGAPYAFVGQASFQSTVNGPNSAIVQLGTQTSDGFFETSQTFGSQALMDATYPSGAYKFTVLNQPQITATLTGDLYPPVPQILNGYWQNGSLLVDPAHDVFVSFPPFPGFSTAGIGGQVEFQIPTVYGPDGVTHEWDSFNSTAAPTGFTIPANSLYPNTTYALTFYYQTYASLDNTSVPGSIALGVYQSRTMITILTQAPPLVAPAALTQPQSQTVSSGSTVVFSFTASGTPAPSYQWFHNGVALFGNLPTLTLTDATSASAGAYTCTATNSAGSVQSAAATLAISQTQDVGRLVNISCRSLVGTGSNIMIAGFVVGGAGTSGSENLLVRGSGPALSQFGVPGVLADPQLQLYLGSSLLITNAGWAGAPAIVAAAASVNAFAWVSGASHDSAALQSLAPGAYTAQIAGQSGDTGVALAEVYDETPAGTYTPASPRLINISARVPVGTGGNILIAGFVIGGSTSRTMLIRASGPALVPFGVPGTLPDPKLQLFSGSTVLATNSGWAGDPAIQSAASSVNAFAWSSSSSTDSAILVTLPPGAYTAQVSGAAGDTGVALVEIYEVP